MPDLPIKLPWRERLFPNQEWALLILLALELACFAVTGNRFWTRDNAMEVIRLSVEVGLLALALTPVIITGGIDLSVGSLLGLCAVAFGALWRDAGWPIGLAMAAALGLGLVGGAINAALITKLRIVPLIVTLGTFSLFRGLAEGITGGFESYTNLPGGFLFLGQGYLAGRIPVQAFLLVAAAVGIGVLLHKTVIGRSLYAIGFSAPGARYAGLPVERRLLLAYLLSGAAAGLAAVVYVAHLGQAKSDAGTGYELMAITAVVLGGTSIFGGRGTIWGTLLGLTVIVVLQNGLRLAGLPAELSGILTGALLLITIGLDRVLHATRGRSTEAVQAGDWEMKNSQVAILSATILVAALIVAGSNWWLVKSLAPMASAGGAAGTTPAVKRPVIALMPKAKGDPYFVSCKLGADEAAAQLGVDLLWDGPTDLDPAKQNEVVESWITRGVDAIAVSVENRDAISTVLRKARQQGIKVVTWDADSAPDARDYFINQATPQGIGAVLADQAAKVLQGRGEFAVVTGSLSAANQNLWIKYIKERVAEKYPQMKLAVIRPSDDDRDRAFSETQTLLKAYPNVKVVVAISAPAVPGAAEAVKQAGRSDVKVLGLSLPNMCKPYVHSGVIDSVVLWNTRDLGYLTVLAAKALTEGSLKPGSTSLTAGRLGSIEVKKDEVMLGAPFVFTKENIDRFNF